MNEDTPLTEVAHLLPTEVASFLSGLNEDLQAPTLEAVRSLVTTIEEEGVTLDVFQLEAVLTGFVPIMVGHISRGFTMSAAIGKIQAAAGSIEKIANEAFL